MVALFGKLFIASLPGHSRLSTKVNHGRSFSSVRHICFSRSRRWLQCLMPLRFGPCSKQIKVTGSCNLGREDLRTALSLEFVSDRLPFGGTFVKKEKSSVPPKRIKEDQASRPQNSNVVF